MRLSKPIPSPVPDVVTLADCGGIKSTDSGVGQVPRVRSRRTPYKSSQKVITYSLSDTSARADLYWELSASCRRNVEVSYSPTQSESLQSHNKEEKQSR